MMNVVDNVLNYFARTILVICSLISLVALFWSSLSIMSYNFFMLSVLFLSSFFISVLPIRPVNKSAKEIQLYFVISFIGIGSSVLVFQEYIFSPHVRISIKIFFCLILFSFIVMALRKYRINKS
jgi:hypothetical protein